MAKKREETAGYASNWQPEETPLEDKRSRTPSVMQENTFDETRSNQFKTADPENTLLKFAIGE